MLCNFFRRICCSLKVSLWQKAIHLRSYFVIFFRKTFLLDLWLFKNLILEATTGMWSVKKVFVLPGLHIVEMVRPVLSEKFILTRDCFLSPGYLTRDNNRFIAQGIHALWCKNYVKNRCTSQNHQSFNRTPRFTRQL